MVEMVSLTVFSNDEKLALLKELGYSSDGIFVLDNVGTRVYDRYLNIPVRVDNMVLFPGSVIILDDNPLSVASYLEEFPNAF